MSHHFTRKASQLKLVISGIFSYGLRGSQKQAAINKRRDKSRAKEQVKLKTA